jgi:hypothetical protein
MVARKQIQREHGVTTYAMVTLRGCAAVFVCAACERVPAASQPVTSAAAALAIDSTLPRLRHDTATVLGLSTEGATIDAAYDGPALRHLSAVYYGETGRVRDRFYLDTSVFYIIRTEARYDEPLSGRVVDSSVRHLDLRRADASAQQRDSVAQVITSLLRARADQ